MVAGEVTFYCRVSIKALQSVSCLGGGGDVIVLNPPKAIFLPVNNWWCYLSSCSDSPCNSGVCLLVKKQIYRGWVDTLSSQVWERFPYLLADISFSLLKAALNLVNCFSWRLFQGGWFGFRLLWPFWGILISISSTTSLASAYTRLLVSVMLFVWINLRGYIVDFLRLFFRVLLRVGFQWGHPGSFWT